jgi:hypothetical protein
MTGSTSRRPKASEYAEYFQRYVRLVPEGEIVSILKGQLAWFESLPPDRWDHRYAPGKWSLKEVVGHVVDTEWVFSYRALRFARGDKTPLAGMEQDGFMAGANFDDRTRESLLAEWRHLRSAGVELFSGFSEEILDRTGQASGYDFSVRAMIYIIAGHALHHQGVIADRYL